MAIKGDFTLVLTRHSKSFSLIDCVSIGVDRMQRNFKPMRKQVEERDFANRDPLTSPARTS
jgi:hypothetical protein